MVARNQKNIVKKGAIKLQYSIRTLLKKCWMPLAIAIILMAIFFSLFRALTPWAKQYKSNVEQHLSSLLGQTVKINDLETSWYWFEPVLKMNQVTLSDQDDHVLHLKKLLVGIDLFSSLWHWQIQPGVLYVEDVNLTLRQTNNHWDVDGLTNSKQSLTLDSKSYLPVLGWVLSQQKIIIKHVSALIYLSDGTLIPLSDLNLTAHHSYGHYRVKGTARLDQATPTELAVVADMQLDPYALDKANGHAYLSVRHFLPKQWQGFLANSSFHIKNGVGDIELWIDLAKGHFLSLQSKLNFNNIVVNQEGHPKRHSLEFLRANLAWRTTSRGWEFTGDQINLRLDGMTWAENSIRIAHDKVQQSFDTFVKTLSLRSLLALDLPWPDQIHELLAIKPRGELQDTRIAVKAHELDYVLSKFTQLGWNERNDIPSVNNISGVFYWQPTEGRLELDGENTTIKRHALPPIKFDQLNAAFDWKQLSNGFRVSMDRFVLSRPDLVLSAQGVLDDAFLPSANLRLTGEFSATNGRRWLDYLPADHLKPKLDAWLKKDIKKINKVSGRVSVNGLLADFPFDKMPGEFSINSYLSGVDLVFAPHWPVSRDIDAHLQINKRSLDAEIFQADLNGVPVEQMSLVLNDIGLGREALLIHGNINAPAEDMEAYVFASPLASHLARLKKISISQLLGLDLHLEVPLYSENEHVYVRGTLTFDNNKVIFHHELNDIELDAFSGLVQFDEEGITQGKLKGNFGEDPIDLTIKAVGHPKFSTVMTIDGSTTMDQLRHKYPTPVLGLLDGRLKFHGLLTLTDRQNDLDRLKITTSLEGISVDLPTPLGKTVTDIAPLVIDLGFNANKTQCALSYKDLLLKATSIDKDDWLLHLKQTNIAADLRYQQKNNMLSGNFKRLYLDNLTSLNKRLKNSNSPIKPHDIPNLNITFDTVKIEDVDIGSASLSSTSNSTKWTLNYCKINSPEYRLMAQGVWTKDDKQNQTNMQAELELSDLAKSLARYHIFPAIEANRGDIKFKGGWAGAIHDFSLDKVSGDLQIIIKDGRITNLDKETEGKLGLGKLLSVLSLQTIPRRLKLDFSDLSKGGYSFDEFKGDFTLKKGVMSTKNSYIDGPVAYASMKGDLNLIKRLYDVDLRVSPYITASLPIVATIAGGPIAGIATWVASKIINKGMQQISAYTYKISGPWGDPIVQQVHLYRKQMQSDKLSSQAEPFNEE